MPLRSLRQGLPAPRRAGPRGELVRRARGELAAGAAVHVAAGASARFLVRLAWAVLVGGGGVQ